MDEQKSERESIAGMGFWPASGIVLAHGLFLAMSSVVWSLFPRTQAAYVVCPGVVMGQTMLLLIWANLGAQPWVRKQTATIAYVLLAFLMHHLWSSGLDAVIAAVLGIPLVLAGCVVLGLPLTLARWGGLRLERFRTGEPPPGRPFQFKLSQVLLLTVLVAILLAPGYLAEIEPHGSGEIELAPLIIVMCLWLIVGGVALFTAPLASVCLVLAPGPGLSRFVAVLFGWGLAGLLIAGYWHKGLEPLVLLGLVLALAVLLIQATLIVLRACRFRTIRRSQG